MENSIEPSIPEKEMDSGNKMEPAMVNMKPADPSPSSCESTTELEGEKLRIFVIVLTTAVLHKYNTRKYRSPEAVSAHIKRLIDQTMEGFTVKKGFLPEIKDIKKVRKAVKKDLQKKFGTKGILETALVLEDPHVDTAIVQCLREKITNACAKKDNKGGYRKLPVMLMMTGVLCFLTIQSIFSDIIPDSISQGILSMIFK